MHERDDQLGTLLTRALAEDVDRPVDVARLLDGARAGARRIRRRRRTGAALLVVLALVAAPSGYRLLEPDSEAVRVASTPVPPEPTLPRPEPPAETKLPALPAPPEFPDEIALPADVFDRPLEQTLDLGNDVNVSTVAGQACSEGEPRPSAGRIWSWAEENSNRLDQLTVTLQLTGWAGAGGVAALRDVADDTGRCRWVDPVTENQVEGLPGEGAWVGGAEVNGLGRGYAVVQLGDVLVAVSVGHPAGREAAVAEAVRLAHIAVVRTANALIGPGQ